MYTSCRVKMTHTQNYPPPTQSINSQIKSRHIFSWQTYYCKISSLTFLTIKLPSAHPCLYKDIQTVLQILAECCCNCEYLYQMFQTSLPQTKDLHLASGF